MGTKGQTIGGGMPGSGKDIISGGHGVGRYGQPHKFYGKSAARYKGPHKQLEDLLGPEKAKTMVKGPDGKMVPDYAVDGEGNGDLKVKLVNEMGNRRRKDTYSYQEPKAKVLGGPEKIKKDKQKISKLQDDVLAGVPKYKCGKK